MSRRALVALSAVTLVVGVLLVVRLAQHGVPLSVALEHAHAHNDYAHARPLLDALDHGFCSVEADVWLVDGRLLVAHDRDEAHGDRTLEALYLDPLRERVRANGGRLFVLGPECTLLVDVKSDAVATYDALRGVLERYSDVLTEFREGRVERRAILVVVSGNTAPATMATEEVRRAAVDGRLLDMRSELPPELVPWISIDWKQAFTWTGEGSMPEREVSVLRELSASAREHGRRLRFWNTPDRTEVWQALWEAQVHLIGADDLAALEAFLRARALPAP